MFPKLKIKTPKLFQVSGPETQIKPELPITFSKAIFSATSNPNLEIKERYESPNSGLSYRYLIFKIG